jgi:hypothetical protein
MRIWRSGGGFDLDIISEVLDAAHEAHGCAGLVITSKVVRSEVAKEGTVAQHMVDGGEDRCGDRDGSLFWSASCFEAQELGLEIGVLGPRRRKGALHEHGFKPRRAFLRFLVGQHLRMIEELEATVTAFDARTEAVLAPFRDAAERLMSLPGISDVAAQVILAEIGTDMSSFPTAGHLLSWAGLTPRLDESAGKRRSTRLR